jgi:TonB family protein
MRSLSDVPKVVAISVLLLATARLLPEVMAQQGYGPNEQANGDRYYVGEGVTAPVVIERLIPEYTVEAKSHKLSGFVAVSCEISAEGRAEKIRVTRPLGLGLDDAAVQALKRWRFRPATKDGRTEHATGLLEIWFRP